MSRIRTIKPDFWTDVAVGECSASARLLFIGTWNFADDNGNIERSSRQLKAQIFPYDATECEPLVGELIAAKLLTEYEVGNKKYLHIKGFDAHQRIDKKSPGKFPVPPSNGVCVEDSQSVHGTLAPEGKGREGKVVEGSGGEIQGAPRASTGGGLIVIHETKIPPPYPPSKDTSSGTPEGQAPQQYASSLLQEFTLATSPSLINSVAGVVESVARKRQISTAAAHDFILMRAKQAEAEGVEVNRFWFEDGKFRDGPPNGRRRNRANLDELYGDVK